MHLTTSKWCNRVYYWFLVFDCGNFSSHCNFHWPDIIVGDYNGPPFLHPSPLTKRRIHFRCDHWRWYSYTRCYKYEPHGVIKYKIDCQLCLVWKLYKNECKNHIKLRLHKITYTQHYTQRRTTLHRDSRFFLILLKFYCAQEIIRQNEQLTDLFQWKQLLGAEWAEDLLPIASHLLEQTA